MMRFRNTDGGGAEMKKRTGLLLVCALLAALLLTDCIVSALCRTPITY